MNNLDREVTILQGLRQQAAELRASMASADLSRRLLKAEIVRELTGRGVSVTAADKVANTDERMLDAERGQIAEQLALHTLEAHAEAQRFRVQIALADLNAQGDA